MNKRLSNNWTGARIGLTETRLTCCISRRKQQCLDMTTMIKLRARGTIR